jgi:S1-C subfamily serine protease
MKPFLSLSLVFAAGITLAQSPAPGTPNQKDANAVPAPVAPPGMSIVPLTPAQAKEMMSKSKSRGAIIPAPSVPQSVINTSSLLKVNVTFQSFNLQIPWQKESAGGRRGLGIVLDKNRVLVTAQMVADSTYIEFELPDSGQKLPARVEAVDYEANLALLAPNSPNKEKDFFTGLKGVQLDTTPRIGDALAVWQSGRVGDLIVTPMRISKVMTQGYFVENAAFLVYEATGIIRSESNSFTLPVVKGGKLAGLLLRYDSKNQVATLLPAPIIDHFLKDVEDGKYDGFPSLGIEFQITQDEQFREYLGLKNGTPGVFISKVMKGGSADAAGMRKGDIMVAINGNNIDARGDYQDKQFGAVSASHLIRGRGFVGDEVTIKVLREGKEIELKGKLTRKEPDDYLVRPYLFDHGPKYVLSGGVLFQELTSSYLASFGGESRGGALLRLQRIASNPEEFEKDGRKKVVFIGTVLPTPSTQGYERMSGQVVLEVNGRKITELADVAAALKEPRDGIHAIKLREFPHLLYLDALRVERDNMQLLNGAFRVGELSRLE